MGWLILAVLALIAFTWAFSYWWWVRSFKEPQKRKRKRKL